MKILMLGKQVYLYRLKVIKNESIHHLLCKKEKIYHTRSIVYF